jgi:hypothetical protein
MSEQHTIVGPAKGEPLPAGRVGVRLRIPLSGSPSERWSRDLSARLTVEFTGRAAVGHLRLNQVIKGHEIVLEGVEDDEAPNIAGAVERAVDATNRAVAERADDHAPAPGSGAKAEAIARTVGDAQHLAPPDRPA